jgi:hypothetical protein
MEQFRLEESVKVTWQELENRNGVPSSQNDV